jgi:hypothetical protein
MRDQCRNPENSTHLIFPVSIDRLNNCVKLRVKSDDSVTTRKLLTELIVEGNLATGGDGAKMNHGFST